MLVWNRNSATYSELKIIQIETQVDYLLCSSSLKGEQKTNFANYFKNINSVIEVKLQGRLGIDLLQEQPGIDLLQGRLGIDLLQGRPGIVLLQGRLCIDLLQGRPGIDLLQGRPSINFLQPALRAVVLGQCLGYS